MTMDSQVGDQSYKPHPLHWVVEPLMQLASYMEKPMFGCRAVYLHGKLVLVLASRRNEPWDGLLIPTEKEYQKSLLNEFPALCIHPVLGKWLYLSKNQEEFETYAETIVKVLINADSRFGVKPKPKRGKQNVPSDMEGKGIGRKRKR